GDTPQNEAVAVAHVLNLIPNFMSMRAFYMLGAIRRVFPLDSATLAQKDVALYVRSPAEMLDNMRRSSDSMKSGSPWAVGATDSRGKRIFYMWNTDDPKYQEMEKLRLVLRRMADKKENV